MRNFVFGFIAGLVITAGAASPIMSRFVTLEEWETAVSNLETALLDEKDPEYRSMLEVTIKLSRDGYEMGYVSGLDDCHLSLEKYDEN